MKLRTITKPDLLVPPMSGVGVSLLLCIVFFQGCVFLEGDNELASFDSRNYGPVHETRIEGVVLMSIWPSFSLSIAPRPASLPRRPSPPAALP